MAQELPRVSLTLQDRPLEEAIVQLQTQTGYSFFYRAEWMDSVLVTIQAQNELLTAVLDQLCAGTPLNYFQQGQRVYFTSDIKIFTSPRLAELLNRQSEAIETNVEKGLVFKREYLGGLDAEDENDRIMEIGKRSQMVAGGTATIAGYVKSAETGEPQIGALVYAEEPLQSALTDENGFYTLTLPPGPRVLHYQLMGMSPVVRRIVLFSNGQLNVDMAVDVLALDEVVIESGRDANVQSVRMGVTSIRVSESKNVPLVLGERDVMKVATTMAGIQTVGEGAAGYNVRGGKADQNLIALDGYPLYNTSHFFGFFSVFNSDVIEDMQVYKSSVPARYGGRLSSVMEIQTKKANRDSISGSGGISPITTRLSLELPLFAGKAGLTVGGRATYSDWVLNQVGNAEFSNNEVAFADVQLRYDHDFDENNRLTLSGYLSNDRFRMDSDTLFSFSNFAYQNQAFSARYGRIFSRQLSGSLTISHAGYHYDLSYDESQENAFSQTFGLEEQTAKVELNYNGYNAHEISGGIEMKRIGISPGTQRPLTENSLVSELDIQREQGLESALFLSDEYAISDRFSLYGGLRYSLFMSLGAQSVNTYLEGAPKNDQTRQEDALQFDRGEIITTYGGLEPRISARYKLGRNSSIKGGYNRMRQYIHTLTNSASVSPTDIWRLTGYHLKPQIADQFSVGYYHSLPRKSIDASAEVYYKDIQNLLDFKVGAEFLLNPFVEAVTLQGPGRSYGFEFSLEKKGRLNGWVNYTYARTLLRLDSEHGEERINGGAYYPANYDIPHTLNLIANYKFTNRLSFSYNFVYKSGRPVTYPTGIYDFYRSVSIHYSDRNAFRIPYYMRMDLGVNLEAGHKKGKMTYSYWSFSVYNLLGRSNAYSVFFSVNRNQIEGHKLVVFGNPIPTISYNFKF